MRVYASNYNVNAGAVNVNFVTAHCGPRELAYATARGVFITRARGRAANIGTSGQLNGAQLELGGHPIITGA